ncbi:VWA domain-containing protein [candidate division WOR-3 bacterium]|nr:VWA domain-containing protein [candidate division WOR-3 bacterium]
MKRAMIFAALVTLILATIPQSMLGQTKDKDDREGLSPYFAIESKDGVENFPLLKNNIKVTIAGMIAEIELTQVYKNDGNKTIEAIYVFPLGTKSAIHAMTMKIGDRTIDAQIEERLKAQKIYQNAKDQGQVASLLEQERPNVFQMKVANIMPGDEIQVIVKYTEYLAPDEGVYQFVFPTVVGPRYIGESDVKDLKGKDSWTQTPYLHEGEEPPYDFDINVNIMAGFPLSQVWVTSHKVKVKNINDAVAELSLIKQKGNSGNRDFILNYTLQGKKIESGILLYPGEKENYFLVMMEPPEKADINMVPPREYVFIVDVSGSMSGFPLEVSKTVIKTIVEGLRREDYFNILFFAGGSDVLAEVPLPATEANKKKAIDMVMLQSGGGGTQILDAFHRAMALPKKKGLSRIIVTATDGYVSVEKEVFDIIEKNPDQSNFFAFGIGSGVNRYIIDGIARVGRGEPYVATNENEAQELAVKFMKYVQHPVLTDIEVQFDGFEAYDVEPVSLPDLFAQRPLILFGKYKKASGTVRIKGNTPAGVYAKAIKVTPSFESDKNLPIMYLWAREKIARLSDYAGVGEDVSKEVTALGLKYHLMTEYTSFVAVDKIVRETGEVVTVKQPVPLPLGVSDYAVGGVAGRAMAKVSGAPMACEEFDGGISYTEIEAQLYISGGTAPAGMSLDDVEDAIFDQVKEELERKFDAWELTSVEIALVFQNGSVNKVTINKHDGKKVQTAVLENILRKITLPSGQSGKVTFTLEYN